MNGPVNSILPKNDLTVKRDDTGSVYFRWLPVWIYADLSRSPTAGMTAHLFPAGTHYQGMEVRPMPTWKEYLKTLFRGLHPQADAVRVSEVQELPRLAELFRQRDRAVIDALRSVGMPGPEFHAGGLVLDYTENGRAYREALLTVVIDNRGSSLSWNNEYTHAMRAPVDEADKFRPVFNLLRQSGSHPIGHSL